VSSTLLTPSSCPNSIQGASGGQHSLATRPPAGPVLSRKPSASLATPLLPLVAQGDAAAIEQCIDRYSGLVWSLARRFLRDQGAAEDAVQEIFLELWKVSARFDASKGSELAFIGTLARRRLIDRVRRLTRRQEAQSMVEEPIAEESSPMQHMANQEDLARAKELVASLPPQQRQAIEFAIFHGMTHAEVSTRMEIPLGTAKSLIRRGLDMVRKRLSSPSAPTPHLS
jgi:RNA polymerase sigma-70 factor (ECF subfamily)